MPGNTHLMDWFLWEILSVATTCTEQTLVELDPKVGSQKKTLHF